jgi:glycosyltransferase involved in cell wall biosynthesis
MIGKGVDFLNKELSKLIPEQYRQNFILLGEVENVMDYMQAMEIFCISSFWGEGFPNVLGEAMLAELPCVVTNIGDSAQVLGECGSIIDMPITEEKITNNLIEMIKLSKVDLKKIGNKGRQRIIENFSIEQTLKKYQMLYTEVLE